MEVKTTRIGDDIVNDSDVSFDELTEEGLRIIVNQLNTHDDVSAAIHNLDEELSSESPPWASKYAVLRTRAITTAAQNHTEEILADVEIHNEWSNGYFNFFRIYVRS